MLAISPVFTRSNLTGLLRGAVAMALAFPMVPYLTGQIASGARNPVALLLLTVKEAAMGAMLGFILGLPFWAFDLAGDLLDQQRGATSGRLNDPAGFEDVSITGTLLVLTGVTLFVATGGLQTLTSLLYASWAVWPPLAAMPQPTVQAPVLLLGFLDAVLRQGVLLGAPVVAAMLLADVALILIGALRPATAHRRLGTGRTQPGILRVHAALLRVPGGIYGRNTLAMPGLLDLMRQGLQ